MQPLHKFSYIIFFVIATLMIFPFMIVSHDLYVWIKLLGVYTFDCKSVVILDRGEIEMIGNATINIFHATYAAR